MASRAQRLGKLLEVQRQMKALHEMRHATHLADAIAAAREAEEVAKRFDESNSLSALFPEVYHRRISQALAREEASRALAEQEIRNIAIAFARLDVVEKDYRAALALERRMAEEREAVEMVAMIGARRR